jgi:formimidoylglutamate deiminase
VLDRLVFAGNRPLVAETWVGGQRVVAQGRHRKREQVAKEYARAMTQLLADEPL